MRAFWPSFIEWIQWLCIATWVGSMVFISFGTAPVAFKVLPTPKLAGLLVGSVLDRFYLLSYLLGPILLITAAIRMRSGRVRVARLGLFAFVVLIVLAMNVYAREVVARRLDSLQQEMGNVEAVEQKDPRRLAFDRLHRRSVQLMGGSLVGGVLMIYLMMGSLEGRRL